MMTTGKSAGNKRGFTLIELMIVVAIVAVLAAIAAPVYRDFVIQSNRSDAIIALSELANLQEKFHSNNFVYTDDFNDLSYPTTSPNDYYSLSIPVATTTNFRLEAVPAGLPQSNDNDCVEFSLNAFGQEQAEDSGGNDTGPECWNR